MPAVTIRDVPPKEAIRVLNRRLANPVETYSWLDVWQHEHSTMFTVAKSAGYDILDDIAAAVQDALANGTTFDDFSRRLIPILQDKGWWGRAIVEDPLTGEMTNVQLGSLRRLQIIYDTNLRMSYSAGRWAAIQRTKADRPYLYYQHNPSLHPREQHLAWNGVTLPVDDPWWETHYTPNGWHCHCTVRSLSQRQYDDAATAGKIITVAPKIIWKPFVNTRTGEVQNVPDGIAPGFGYNVGQAFLAALAA